MREQLESAFSRTDALRLKTGQKAHGILSIRGEFVGFFVCACREAADEIAFGSPALRYRPDFLSGARFGGDFREACGKAVEKERCWKRPFLLIEKRLQNGNGKRPRIRSEQLPYRGSAQ